MAQISKAQFRGVPLTVLDIARKTEQEMNILTGHCNRTFGKLDNVDFERTKDNIILIGTDEPMAVQGRRHREKLKADLHSSNVKPFTSLVLGASPEYFRPDDPKAKGEYDKERLVKWVKVAKKWALKQFGRDVIYMELHLDEATPHLHVVILPTVEKKPTMPKRPRRAETEKAFEARVLRALKWPEIPTERAEGESEKDFERRVKKAISWKPNPEMKPTPAETQEQFQKRVERAKKKKGKIVISHHSHPFLKGWDSYSKVLDSYAEAVAPLGIERGERGAVDEKGNKVRPTTKAQWAEEMLQAAKQKEKLVEQREKIAEELELAVISTQRQRELEDESFEFGSQAVIEEKIEYKPADEAKGEEENLQWGKNKPAREEQLEIVEKVKPAKQRIIQFARFMKEMAEVSYANAKQKITKAYKNLLKREAAADARDLAQDAREKAQDEREKQLDIIESLDAEVEDGSLGEADDKKLRDAGIIKDQQTPESFLKIQEERVLQKERQK